MTNRMTVSTAIAEFANDHPCTSTVTLAIVAYFLVSEAAEEKLALEHWAVDYLDDEVTIQINGCHGCLTLSFGLDVNDLKLDVIKTVNNRTKATCGQTADIIDIITDAVYWLKESSLSKAANTLQRTSRQLASDRDALAIEIQRVLPAEDLGIQLCVLSAVDLIDFVSGRLKIIIYDDPDLAFGTFYDKPASPGHVIKMPKEHQWTP